MKESYSVGEYIFDIQTPYNWTLVEDTIIGYKEKNNLTAKNRIEIRFNTLCESLNIGDQIFVADNKKELFLQNIWSVHKLGDEIFYSIEFFDHHDFTKIVFTYKKEIETIDVYVLAKNKDYEISISPFLHPLGVLMLARLQQVNGGLMIHGSGIKDGNNGYIFTGISGIGKSTMACIWQSIGAEIVNDDRLMIYEGETGFFFNNTPMPYYNDISKQAPLKAIFLLSQSITNHCTRITGIQALAKVMANFMQQLFDADMVKEQLNQTEKLISQTPVYQLGFKPDADVVQLIRSLNL